MRCNNNIKTKRSDEYFVIKVLILLLVLAQVLSTTNGKSTCSSTLKHRNCHLLPDGMECGPVRVSARVIGGNDASFGQFPWVSLLMTTDKTNPNKFQLCSASVISNRYLVSSGHCCWNQQVKILRIGEFDLTQGLVCNIDGEVHTAPTDVEVEDIIIHNEFRPKQHNNDVCLIRLKNPITFNGCLSPICLPIFQSSWKGSFPFKSLEVAGWGVAMEKPDGTPLLPEVLQTLALPIIPLGMCQWMYSLLSFNITPKHICAGGVEGENICIGDSGGPLMEALSVDNQPLRYFLVGVSSFTQTKPCARKLPSVYGNIVKYVNWILDNIKS